MSADVFVDTHGFVYARDAWEPLKQPRAYAWLQHLWSSRTGRVGVQVLNEYYVTVTRKLDPGLSRPEARADVQALMARDPVLVDENLARRAFGLEDVASLSWRDALVVAAARQSGRRFILSEDLPTGPLVVGPPMPRARRPARGVGGAPPPFETASSSPRRAPDPSPDVSRGGLAARRRRYRPTGCRSSDIISFPAERGSLGGDAPPSAANRRGGPFSPLS
jgi:predicted nucleic acid-binding protein